MVLCYFMFFSCSAHFALHTLPPAGFIELETEHAEPANSSTEDTCQAMTEMFYQLHSTSKVVRTLSALLAMM